MKRTIQIVFFLSVIFFIVHLINNRVKNLVSKRYEQGIACLEKKRYGEAIAEFNKVIEANSRLLGAYINRGNAYREKGDFNKAISNFNTALQINPKEAVVYYNRGLTYHKKEDFEKAMADYTQALQYNPGLYQARGNRADIFMLKEDFSSAVLDLTKALEISRCNSILFYSDGKSVKSKINSQCLSLYFCRGNVYSQMGDFDHAISDYESALHMEPGDGEINHTDLADNLACAYNNKAYSCYLEGENLEEGLKIIDKALALIPNNGIYLGTKAELLYKARRYQEAHQYIKKALQLMPNHPELTKDLKNIVDALGGVEGKI